MKNWIISGFSDEIDENIEKQFHHLNKLGISYFEPRGINGNNISDLTDGEVSALKSTMDRYGIKVSSIGSPIGKIQITDEFAPHLEKLRRTIRIAKELHTRYIRVFSFYIPKGEYGKYRGEVMERMKEMTALAEQKDIILLHENEKGIYGDTAPRCREILDEVHSAHLRAVFDTANFVKCGQSTYPEAYELIRPYLAYMHIKDALADGSVVPAGRGIGQVEKILFSLSQSGYEGFFSLEPHLGDFKGFSELESKAVEKKEISTPEKFTLAYESLKELFQKVEETL